MAMATAATMPRRAVRHETSAPTATPEPRTASPSCVAPAGSGPVPRPPAIAACAPFVPPVSATNSSGGTATRPKSPRTSGRRH